MSSFIRPVEPARATLAVSPYTLSLPSFFSYSLLILHKCNKPVRWLPSGCLQRRASALEMPPTSSINDQLPGRTELTRAEQWPVAVLANPFLPLSFPEFE